MYVDLFESPLKMNGRYFFVQFEPEEQHYRIEFVGNDRPLLLAIDENGKWYDLKDGVTAFAMQLGEFLNTKQKAEPGKEKSI